MTSIRVTFADGNSLITQINGTDTEVRGYYLKAEGFELDEAKPLVKAISVEFLGRPRITRACNSNDLILVKEGMQCANCLATEAHSWEITHDLLNYRRG